MIRNLKALGLALVAVFAMSAVAATGASAATGEFQWEAGTTKIVGEADPTAPSQEFKITPGAITASFTCDEVSGEATGLTGTSDEGKGVTAQNIVYSDTGTTPAVEECTGKVNGIAVKTPVKFNGCDYKFTADKTVGAAGAGLVEGTVHIVCAGANVIEVKAAGCLVKVAPQTVGRITYTTKTTGDGLEHVTAHAEVGLAAGNTHNDAIDYTTSGITCGVHNETDGTYEGKVTFSGFDANKNKKKVTVT
jgi:hypothetical protein